MNEILKYIKIGMEHIFDLNGLDHILFMASLILVYTFTNWKRLLMLLTAFTIGHAVALVTIALDLYVFPSELVELAIPLTIVLMAVFHMITKSPKKPWDYIMAMLFGFIHGSAFAQDWFSLFGRSGDFLMATIGFNIGIELAQAITAFILLAAVELLVASLKWSREKLRVFIFGAIVSLALYFILLRI